MAYYYHSTFDNFINNTTRVEPRPKLIQQMMIKCTECYIHRFLISPAIDRSSIQNLIKNNYFLIKIATNPVKSKDTGKPSIFGGLFSNRKSTYRVYD